MKLIIDSRMKNLNKDIEYEDADFDQAIQLLNLLDGKKHTLLTIDFEDGRNANIGGGTGKYIVTLSLDDKNMTLINPRNDDDNKTLELCAGGQYADFPENIVVDNLLASRAISLFFEENEENELIWDMT